MNDENKISASSDVGGVYQEICRHIVVSAAPHLLDFLYTEIVAQEHVVTLAREGRRGDRTHPLDAWMDKVVRNYVTALVPEAEYLSEENEASANLRPGEIIFRADAVDGTGNALTMFNGCAIVVFAEKVSRNGDALAHLGGAIYSATGHVVSWGCFRRQGSVRIDFPAAPTYDVEVSVPVNLTAAASANTPRTLWLSCDEDGGPADLLRPGNPRRVAVVATSSKRRGLMSRTFDFDASGTWVANLAGNPLAAPLLVGQLGGIVEPERVALHDAAFLIPLKLAGGYVCGYDGEPLDVFDRFEQIKNERMIGPFVAAADAVTAEEILESLTRGDDDQPASAPRVLDTARAS